MAGRGVYKTFLPAFVFTPKGNGYTCRTYTSQGIRDIRISDKRTAFCIALVFNWLRWTKKSAENEKSISAKRKIIRLRLIFRLAEKKVARVPNNFQFSTRRNWNRAERWLNHPSVHNSLNTRTLRWVLKDEACFPKIPGGGKDVPLPLLPLSQKRRQDGRNKRGTATISPNKP